MDDSGKAQGFQYSFTPRELAFFLFAKKECPVCGGPLAKRKKSEIVLGENLNGRSNPFFVPNAKIRKYSFAYACKACGAEYGMPDLIETRESRRSRRRDNR